MKEIMGNIMDKTPPLIIACIPAYQVETTLGNVLVQTQPYVDQIIVCDDGSLDHTSEIAQVFGAEVICHDRNLGYGAAIKSLFEEAVRIEADIVITLDGDGQHSPSQIPSFLRELDKKNADIVIGSRFIEGSYSGAPIWRTLGIRFLTLLTSHGNHLTDNQCGFRAYSSKALNSLNLIEDGMGISTEIIIKAQAKKLTIVEVPVSVLYDKNSSSKHPVAHGVGVLLDTVKHLAMKRPLLVFGVPGFFSLCVATLFWFMMFRIYSDTHMMSTNVALLALSATLIGLIFVMTSITIWIIVSIENARTATV